MALRDELLSISKKLWSGEENPMRTLLPFGLPSALMLLWACAGPGTSTGEVRLSVEPATVSPGDSVTLVLTNPTPADIGYNLCTSRLEARVGEGWEAIPSDRMCTMELRALASDGEARFTLRLPPDLDAGEYRYRASVERRPDGTLTRVRSEVFRVGR